MKPSEAKQYHNPDPLSRILGRRNESSVIVNGKKITSLLDGGADCSSISAEYCQRENIPVYPLDSLLKLVGTGGHDIPYLGFCEVKLEVPHAPEFQEDTLVLVLPHTEYHDRVPLTLGTYTLDRIVAHSPDDEKLDEAWKLVKETTLIALKEQLGITLGDRLDLGMVHSAVRLTKDVVIPPGKSVAVPGITRFNLHQKRVHIITQEKDGKCDLPNGVEACPAYTTLKPGSSRVKMILRNRTSQEMRVGARSVVGRMDAANAVPPALVPKVVEERACPISRDNGDVSEPCKDTGSPAETSMPDVGPGQPRVHWNPCQPLPPEELRGSGEPLKPRPLTEEMKEEMWSRVPKGELHTWDESFQRKAKELFVKWEHIISRDDLDLGHAVTYKHDIVLSDPTPVKSRYRRIPPQNYQEVKDHLQEMLRMGVIQKSFSSWASPVVLARRKNGKLRFCVDLRGVNKKTVRDAHPIPRIEETLDRLKGAAIFSSLDLKCGFWEVEITDRAKPYTAFTCGPLGFYECARMPFGLTNAPATFQRLMESCLGDLHLQCCLIYLDDVIIYSSSPEEHLESLDKVFSRLADAGLKLKLDKCSFFQSEVEYLGHVVSKDGVKPNNDRIAAVQGWTVPKTLSQLRSFLGFASYYRKFIRNFAKIARPLYAQLTNESSRKAQTVKIEWNNDCQAAFDELKTRICEAPCLGFPDFDLPFLLKTDASGGGLGAVLYQIQEGKERVIAFASRSLQPAETRYPAFKLEFLALKWAVTEKLKDYLWGSKFVVYTDNNPLTYMRTTGKLDATTQRWVAALACYDFDIVYRAGKLNVEADALSRMKWPDEDEEVDSISLPGGIVSAVVNEARLAQVGAVPLGISPTAVEECRDEEDAEGLSEEDWRKAQGEDPSLAKILSLWEDGSLQSVGHRPGESEDLRKLLKQRTKLKVRNKILFRKRRFHGRTFLQAVLPPSLRMIALQGAHDKIGHLGRDKTLEILQERVWWPGMRRDVVTYVANCERCIRFKSPPERAPMEPFTAGTPMELVHIDFLKLEGKDDTYRDILVITDHFTGYAQAHVCANQKAPLVAKVLVENFFQHYGLPDKIISDQGTNFESDLIKELCGILGVKKIRTTPYHPQTNGSCERFNRTLIGMIGTLPEKEKSKWQSSLKALVHAYNSTVCRMTGFSPFYLMFGRSPRLALDIELGLKMPRVSEPRPTSTFVRNLKKRLSWAHKIARQQREKSAGMNKESYDRKTRCSKLEIGDTCLVRTVAWSGKHKIQDRWDPGVYVVKDIPIADIPVFTVKCDETGKEKTLHRNLLLPLRQGGQLLSDPEENIQQALEDVVDVVNQEEVSAKTEASDPIHEAAGASFHEAGESPKEDIDTSDEGSEEEMPVVDLDSEDEPILPGERRYPRRERKKPNWFHRAWSGLTQGLLEPVESGDLDPGLGTMADML